MTFSVYRFAIKEISDGVCLQWEQHKKYINISKN